MRRRFAIGIVLALLVGVPSAAAAASFHVFGPEPFTRGTGAPRAVVRDVSVLDAAAPYILIVRNSAGGEPVSSAVIALNGRVIVGPQDFSHAAGVIQRPVSLARTSTLSVELRSKPGSRLSVEIVGTDDLAPALTLEAGGTPLAITARYADATAGVDVASFRVTLDGADVTATCEVGPAAATCRPAAPAAGHHTAAAGVRDRAGNAATATAAFDVGGGAGPTLTDVRAPQTIPLGGAGVVSFAYTAGAADILWLIRTREDAWGQRRTDNIPARLRGIRGPAGQASFELDATGLGFGDNRITLSLQDRAGRMSVPATFVVRLVGAVTGGAPPVIQSFTAPLAVWNRPPATSYAPNGKGLTSKLRPSFGLAYADADGDIERVVVRVTDPSGQTTTNEFTAASLRLTGVAGTIEHAFLTLRAGSALGRYRVAATLLDRSGQLSVAATAEVELVAAGGAAPLAINAVTPGTGAAGTEVVITGTGFDAGPLTENVVTLAQVICDVVEATPTTLRVVVPSRAGAGKFTVRNRVGVAVSEAVFAVPVALSVAPGDARVAVTGTQPFSVAVVSSFFSRVTWSVNGIAGGDGSVGTISPSGLYTAPADVPPGGMVTVRATLDSDPTVHGEVQASVLPPPATAGKATVLAATGGRVVSRLGGASVSIPPGALAATARISLNELVGAESPAPPPGRRVLGAVRLGPSGLTFAQPVKVVLPLARFVVPGTTLPVSFVGADGSFVRTEGLTARVLESGEQAEASIGHFSIVAVDEPERLLGSSPGLQFLRIDAITPASALEGLRVPVLLTGFGFAGDMTVRILREDGSATTDIVPGTVYVNGAQAGVLLKINTIPNLGEGQRRDYRLRLERLGGVLSAETVFTVVGLDELVETQGPRDLTLDTPDQVQTRTRRYSEVRVAFPGRLTSVPPSVILEVTGPVSVEGAILANGASGAHGAGQEPGGRLDRGGAGGRGRDDHDCFALPFGITPGSDGFDCAEEENWGEDADACVGHNDNNPRRTGDCLRPSNHPRGLGGRPGFNEDNLSLGDLLAAIANTIGCAATLTVGCLLSTGANIFDVIDGFTTDETITLGGNGFGATDGHGGGGGGGGGKVDGLEGGGGGAGGEPGRALTIISAGQVGVHAPITAAGGDGGSGGLVQECGGVTAALSQIGSVSFDETLACLAESGSFFVALKDNLAGVVIDETKGGIQKFVEDQFAAGASIGDILGNIVSTFGADVAASVAEKIQDPSPFGVAAAIFDAVFDGIKLTNLVNTGGGAGGGAGGHLGLIAAQGVVRGPGARLTAAPGEGGFGGVSIVDDKNGTLFHYVYRSTRPTEAFGGDKEIADPFRESGRAIFDPFTIETGVTDRTLLRGVRINAGGLASLSPFVLHPIKISVACEADPSKSSTILVPRAPDQSVAAADLVLCPGFNTVTAAIEAAPDPSPARMHELLAKRILVMTVDSDGDGLGDRDEAALGTDPMQRDTDGDGLSDLDEVLRGTNPLSVDTDGDGLRDGDEVARGTSPTNRDTDGDGFSDWLEVLLGSDPTRADSRPTRIPDGILFAQSANELLVVDLAGGRAEVLGRPTTAGRFGLAFDENARLFIANTQDLETFDPVTATTFIVGPFDPFAPAGGDAIEVAQLAYDPVDHLLYGVELGAGAVPTGQLVRIHPVTALAARVGAGGTPAIHALAFDADGRLFAAVEGAASDRLVELDRITGVVAREVGTLGVAPVTGLAFDRAGTLLGAHRLSITTSRLLTIDPASAAVTPGAIVARALTGLAVMPCPAPCFAPAITTAVPGFLSAIVVADVDGDGHQDVVGVDTQGARLILLRGNGDGTLQPPVAVALQPESRPVALAVGNLTGRPGPHPPLDVVVAHNAAQSVSVLLNDGQGGLLPPTTFPVGGVGGSLNAVAVGDVNGDGRPDVLAGVFDAATSMGMVSILAGFGNGGFGSPVLVPAARFGVRGLAVRDVDGDGHLDVATAHSDGAVVVTFGPLAASSARFESRVSGAAMAVAIGDVNRDGRPDLVVLDIETRCVVTFLGVGARTFSSPACSPTGPRPGGLAVGDVTGDGNEDALTINTRPDALTVLYGRGAGVFVPALRSPFALSSPSAVAVGDLDGDGLADVVVTTPAGVVVLPNRSPF